MHIEYIELHTYKVVINVIFVDLILAGLWKLTSKSKINTTKILTIHLVMVN